MLHIEIKQALGKWLNNKCIKLFPVDYCYYTFTPHCGLNYFSALAALVLPFGVRAFMYSMGSVVRNVVVTL